MSEMEKFRYFIEENVIDVYRPQNIEGMYRVEWEATDITLLTAYIILNLIC